jgi:hypothetical protein
MAPSLLGRLGAIKCGNAGNALSARIVQDVNNCMQVLFFRKSIVFISAIPATNRIIFPCTLRDTCHANDNSQPGRCKST